MAYLVLPEDLAVRLEVSVMKDLGCGSFPNLGVPYFGVLIIRILLFRVLYKGPLFSETPM